MIRICIRTLPKYRVSFSDTIWAEFYRYRRSLTRFRLNGQAGIMQPGQIFNQRQTKTGSCKIPSWLCLQLLEFGQGQGDILRLHANACINHLQLHSPIRTRLRANRDGPATGGKFDRIREQIQQDLFYAALIT